FAPRATMRKPNNFSLLLLASATGRTCLAARGVTHSTTVLKRGADAGLTSSLDATEFGEDFALALFDPCAYDGIISFSHPMSLKPGDRYFSLGQLQLEAMEIVVEEINVSPRCGVLVDGKRYGISMTTYGDDSSKAKVSAIVEHGMIPAADAKEINTTFWLAPYSSGLTGMMSAFANETNTVLIAGGSMRAMYARAAVLLCDAFSANTFAKQNNRVTCMKVLQPVCIVCISYVLSTSYMPRVHLKASTTVFKGYPTIFGTPPPTKKYLAQGIESLAKAGAKTFASVWEDAGFTRGVCAALPELAERFGLAVQSQTEVSAGPTAEDFDPVAQNLSSPDADPDVVVTCVYDKGCVEWVGALRRANWSPRAQVFTVCIGMDSFVDAVGENDAKFFTGIATWDPNLAMRDAVVGWNASEFADLFLANTARKAAYQSASAAGAVTALVQAIERANEFDSDTVASILSTEEFNTVFGKLSFDENGQSKAPSLHLQYGDSGAVQIVYPPESATGTLVYPMPTWAERDCALVSTCTTGSISTSKGSCNADGSCACADPLAISTGRGPDASCVIIPEEDYTHINSALGILGIVLFVIQLSLTVGCMAWTVYYRERRVVKASQPLFLCLVLFGTLVMSLSIIPLGVQGKYRYTEDERTGEVTEIENPDIGRVDAACMALPWLFSIGFGVIFSALFAKIWRVKMLFKAATSFVRKKIGFKVSLFDQVDLRLPKATYSFTLPQKDVAAIMVAVIAVQFIILLCWQIIDPLRWQREVLFTDGNGYPTKSVGHCKSESTLYFIVPLVVVDGLMLFYALYLCFITRNVPSDFQEGTWITASVLSILQILVLAIPILLIVDNNTDAFYFVRTVVIFLITSTVTLLIFLPKMYRLHYSDTNQRRGPTARISTVQEIQRRSQMSGSEVQSSEVHRRSFNDQPSTKNLSKGSASMCSNAAVEVEETLGPKYAKRVSFEGDTPSRGGNRNGSWNKVEMANEEVDAAADLTQSRPDQVMVADAMQADVSESHQADLAVAQCINKENVETDEELGGDDDETTAGCLPDETAMATLNVDTNEVLSEKPITSATLLDEKPAAPTDTSVEKEGLMLDNEVNAAKEQAGDTTKEKDAGEAGEKKKIDKFGGETMAESPVVENSMRHVESPKGGPSEAAAHIRGTN
ncbi:hypothetical protein ACHAWF_009103, partial [Thalassiosira exigua]